MYGYFIDLIWFKSYLSVLMNTQDILVELFGTLKWKHFFLFYLTVMNANIINLIRKKIILEVSSIKVQDIVNHFN